MPTTVPKGIEDDIKLLKSAAVHAGIIALGFFRTDMRTWTKNITSPVSEADIAVDNFLSGALRAARPDYGWLSEETADSPARLDHQRIFIVDPIDGTRGYIRGIEFKNLDEVDIVGVYPNYASAYAVWKQKAQMTVDNAEMRYFIVHMHKLLDPAEAH
eukprot:jgi/Tetstr1/452828/TSEL_039864.t1